MEMNVSPTKKVSAIKLALFAAGGGFLVCRFSFLLGQEFVCILMIFRIAWTFIIHQAHLFKNGNKLGYTIPGWPVRMDYWLRSSSVLLHWYSHKTCCLQTYFAWLGCDTLMYMLMANVFFDVLCTFMYCGFIRSCRCESFPGLRNKFKRNLERTW